MHAAGGGCSCGRRPGELSAEHPRLQKVHFHCSLLCRLPLCLAESQDNECSLHRAVQPQSNISATVTTSIEIVVVHCAGQPQVQASREHSGENRVPEQTPLAEAGDLVSLCVPLVASVVCKQLQLVPYKACAALCAGAAAAKCCSPALVPVGFPFSCRGGCWSGGNILPSGCLSKASW